MTKQTLQFITSLCLDRDFVVKYFSTTGQSNRRDTRAQNPSVGFNVGLKTVLAEPVPKPRANVETSVRAGFTKYGLS